MTKISREALNRKLARVIQTVENRKASDRKIQNEQESLRSLKDKLEKSIDDFYENDTLNKLESRGKLIQSLESAYADAQYQLDVLNKAPEQSYSGLIDLAVDSYLESIDAYRKSGGEYFDGSVQFEPEHGNHVEALRRVVAGIEEAGHPVKILNEPTRIPPEERGFRTRIYSPLEFVTSLAGVDEFEKLARSEGLRVQGDLVECKRMMLDFSGDIWATDDVTFDPETDNHGGHVNNGYEKRAFVMAQGRIWQSGYDYDEKPKARKFLTMALSGSAMANENQIFYMYRSKSSPEGSTTPGFLAQSVLEKEKRDRDGEQVGMSRS